MRLCIAELKETLQGPDGRAVPTGVNPGGIEAARHREDDGQQQHQADLEEQGNADDHGDERHRPRHAPDARVAQHRLGDHVGAAGVGQQLAQHGAEGDDDPHVAERSADPRLEGEHGLRGAMARQEADEDRPDGEGEEGVQPYCRDEHDDEKDAGGGIEEQSYVVSRHAVRGPSLRPRPPDARIARLIRFFGPGVAPNPSGANATRGIPGRTQMGASARAPLGTFNSPKMYASNAP
jgi:hypothetical protein